MHTQLITTKEADDRKTYLDDDDPLEVSLMLTYFYSHDYDADSDEVRETDSAITGDSVGELEMNVRMWTLGDKYGCMHLQYFALTSMTTQFKHDFEFGMKDFLAAVKYTYEIRRLEDASLRVRLVEALDAAWRTKQLGQVTKEMWMQIGREFPEFMADLMVEHTKILGVGP